MKTETQIAKENVKLYEKAEGDKCFFFKGICQEHLQSCQRFLEWVEIWANCGEITNTACQKDARTVEKDLQQAIKTYKDGGVE